MIIMVAANLLINPIIGVARQYQLIFVEKYTIDAEVDADIVEVHRIFRSIILYHIPGLKTTE